MSCPLKYIDNFINANSFFFLEVDFFWFMECNLIATPMIRFVISFFYYIFLFFCLFIYCQNCKYCKSPCSFECGCLERDETIRAVVIWAKQSAASTCPSLSLCNYAARLFLLSDRRMLLLLTFWSISSRSDKCGVCIFFFHLTTNFRWLFTL